MKLTIRKNEPLSNKTTFCVGGNAAHYVEACDEASIRQAIEWADANSKKLFILGGGSNVLVSDRGVDGLILRVGIRGIRHEIRDDHAHVSVGAGETWDDFVAKTVSENWAGIECLSGIPGDVGAAPIQNIGAYGQEAGEVITTVHAIDRQNGELVHLDKLACDFAYRDSVFKTSKSGQYIVTTVTFSLRRHGPPAVRYAELQRYLKERGEDVSPTLSSVRNAMLELRRRKSMLLDPTDENVRSAGSFFLNPILDDDTWKLVRSRIEASGVVSPGETIPQFDAGPGRTKLAAAWLIERAGFSKGTSDGPVGLSTKHTLAIVNRGGATATDILQFVRKIRDRVHERFGVRLVPEPVMLGFADEEIADLRH